MSERREWPEIPEPQFEAAWTAWCNAHVEGLRTKNMRLRDLARFKLRRALEAFARGDEGGYEHPAPPREEPR